MSSRCVTTTTHPSVPTGAVAASQRSPSARTVARPPPPAATSERSSGESSSGSDCASTFPARVANRLPGRRARLGTRGSGDRTGRSHSARLTENEREPRTAAGTTPTSAKTAKILLRNCTGRDPLADLEHRARESVAARNHRVRPEAEIQEKNLPQRLWA